MSNPLLSDKRPHGAHLRSSEVINVDLKWLLSHPRKRQNRQEPAHDTLCDVCKTGGNVKNVDPRHAGDGQLDDAPETGRSYLWHFGELEWNHWCPMCRLIWKTFRPFYAKLLGSLPPNAVLGYNKGREDGEPRWIEIMAMVFKETGDNVHFMKSGNCDIYEDERIPHFNITQNANHETSANGSETQNGWRQSKILRNDSIEFNTLKKWITICKTEHGSKCNRHEKGTAPARRLIDVEAGCIVDGATAIQYLALSYVWGMAAQPMLTKDIVQGCGKEHFLSSLGAQIPQSIKDAMEVCRRIDVRYLWVDALCIVQDDNDDRDHQIGMMDEIYGSALAVLVVATGEDAHSGIAGMEGRPRVLISHVEPVDGKQLMTSLSSTTLSAKLSKWNTRAWTYQEYILGNRLLVFTDTYVFFKCPTAMFRDDAVTSTAGTIPSIPVQSDDQWISYSVHDIPKDMPPKQVWKDYYDKLLAIYLRRGMKFESDALPAFSGVLKVLSKTLGPFHYGLPKKYFGLSLLWGASHHGIFDRRGEFPSWSWAGWKWTFDYFNAERSLVGVYGYGMPKEKVPMQFFVFDKGGRLVPFCQEEAEPNDEEEPAKPHQLDADDLVARIMHWNSQLSAQPNLSKEEGDARMLRMLADMKIQYEAEQTQKTAAEHEELYFTLLSQFDPPENHLGSDNANLISHLQHPEHLIAFYTSVAALKVQLSEGEKITPGVTAEYDVIGSNGMKLFDCRIDPAWRDAQPESLEFAVLGLKGKRSGVTVMLLQNIDRVYYRVSWDSTFSQHFSVERWMDQEPVQKLVVLA